MKGLTPTQRTLRALRQEGYLCGIVERFNPHVGKYGIRQDLFGIFDIIAITPNGICGIQSCGQSYSEHNKRILESEYAIEWLKAGGNIELWSWRKVLKKRGGKLKVWMPKVKKYTLEDFDFETKNKSKSKIEETIKEGE